MFNKKIANVYMDAGVLLYTIKQKKTEDIHGKVMFAEEDRESYPTRLKKLRSELLLLSKKSKVKSFNLIITDNIRMVKVLKFDREVKLNNDIELVLKEEISKFMQPSENINDYSIHYLKTGKKTQNTFLTAVVRKKNLTEISMVAMQDKLLLNYLTIPEVAMYDFLKLKNGVNVAALYLAETNELRLLACNGAELIYANQLTSIYGDDLLNELNNLEEFIRQEYKQTVNMFHIIGEDTSLIIETDNIKHIDIDRTIDSKYALTMYLQG